MNHAKQLDVLIALLAEQVLGKEEIKNLIVHRKRNPHKWIKGYNACDGTKGVTQIANVVGVTQSVATRVLQSWEQLGIVYDVGTKNKPGYKNLLTVDTKTKKKR